MTKRAQLADGTILEFPADTPDEVMDSVVRQHISGQAPQAAQPVAPPVAPHADGIPNPAAPVWNPQTGQQDSTANYQPIQLDAQGNPISIDVVDEAPAPQQPDNTANGPLEEMGAVGGTMFRGLAALPDMFLDARDALFPNIQTDRSRFSDIPDMLGAKRPNSSGVEFAGNVLGGMVIPGPKAMPQQNALAQVATKAEPKAVNALADPKGIVEAGKREGVRVMTSDVKPPRTFIGKSARALGERIPIIGTGAMRASQQESRVQAVKSLMDEYGAVAPDEIAADLAATRSGAIKSLTKAKNSVIEGLSEGASKSSEVEMQALKSADGFGGGFANDDFAEAAAAVKSLESRGLVEITSRQVGPNSGVYFSLTEAGKKAAKEGLPASKGVPTPNASKAIDEQIQRLRGINEEAFAPVIAKLKNFEAQLESGLTLSQVEGNRRLLGDLFADPSLASIKGDGQKALNAIYGPLREDMGAFIKQVGGEGQFNKWKSANDRLAAMAGELDSAAFKSALNKVETTPEAAAKLLFSKTPSEVKRLYRNLSPQGRVKAQSAIIHEALTKAGGAENLSPDNFRKAMEAMDNATGIFFAPADKARLDGLTRLLKATARASEAGVMTNSGQQAVPFLVGGAATQAPVAVAGAALLARLYETAPVRDALLRVGRSKPGSQQEKIATAGAEKIIARYLAKTAPVVSDRVERAVTTSPAPRAAAEDQDK